MRNDAQPRGEEIVTAALMVIGDEILSGRTKDKNIGHIADHLTAIGIQLKEVRIVPDEEAEIVAAVNALRARYTYVFTTGGIGPTHDDKTADAVAAAFGVHIGVREDARAILETHYTGPGGLNEARLRMARIPDGASLIANPVSRAPGFQMGNVFVLAGDGPLIRGETLATLLQRHRAMGAAATLATSVISDPAGYGRIVRDGAGAFRAIVEQKNATPEQL